MVKENSDIIQAFPITPATYAGTPSAFDVKGYSVIHAGGDGQITFDFGTQGTVVVEAQAGQDFAIHDSCIAITAAMTCLIS